MKILTFFCLAISFIGILANNDTDTQPEKCSTSSRQLQLGVNLIELTDEKAYACKGGCTYLTYKDYLINQNKICNKVQRLKSYRLEGGASMVSSLRQCLVKRSNRILLTKAICVRTSFDELPVVVEGDCPYDSDTVSLEEAAANTQEFCDLIDPYDAVKIGLGGSLSGVEGGCTISDWDTTPTKSLCIKRKINDIRIVNANEDICGKGQTLLTVQEALARREEYCELLPEWGIVRLSGGASIDGPGYRCKIHEADNRQLGQALCGDAYRRNF